MKQLWIEPGNDVLGLKIGRLSATVPVLVDAFSLLKLAGINYLHLRANLAAGRGADDALAFGHGTGIGAQRGRCGGCWRLPQPVAPCGGRGCLCDGLGATFRGSGSNRTRRGGRGRFGRRGQRRGARKRVSCNRNDMQLGLRRSGRGRCGCGGRSNGLSGSRLLRHSDLARLHNGSVALDQPAGANVRAILRCLRKVGCRVAGAPSGIASRLHGADCSIAAGPEQRVTQRRRPVKPCTNGCRDANLHRVEMPLRCFASRLARAAECGTDHMAGSGVSERARQQAGAFLDRRGRSEPGAHG